MAKKFDSDPVVVTGAVSTVDSETKVDLDTDADTDTDIASVAPVATANVIFDCTEIESARKAVKAGQWDSDSFEDTFGEPA